jgi:Ca2+-binding EF-hand superfamily protein
MRSECLAPAVACASDCEPRYAWRPAVAPAAVCASDGAGFVFSGCAADACTPGSGCRAGYTVEHPGASTAPGLGAVGCGAGYTASIRPQAACGGGDFSFAGCVPACTLDAAAAVGYTSSTRNPWTCDPTRECMDHNSLACADDNAAARALLGDTALSCAAVAAAGQCAALAAAGEMANVCGCTCTTMGAHELGYLDCARGYHRAEGAATAAALPMVAPAAACPAPGAAFLFGGCAADECVPFSGDPEGDYIIANPSATTVSALGAIACKPGRVGAWHPLPSAAPRASCVSGPDGTVGIFKLSGCEKPCTAGSGDRTGYRTGYDEYGLSDDRYTPDAATASALGYIHCADHISYLGERSGGTRPEDSYTGTAAVRCEEIDGEFVFTGCEPTCGLVSSIVEGTIDASSNFPAGYDVFTKAEFQGVPVPSHTGEGHLWGDASHGEGMWRMQAAVGEITVRCQAHFYGDATVACPAPGADLSYAGCAPSRCTLGDTFVRHAASIMGLYVDGTVLTLSDGYDVTVWPAISGTIDAASTFEAERIKDVRCALAFSPDRTGTEDVDVIQPSATCSQSGEWVLSGCFPIGCSDPMADNFETTAGAVDAGSCVYDDCTTLTSRLGLDAATRCHTYATSDASWPAEPAGMSRADGDGVPCGRPAGGRARACTSHGTRTFFPGSSGAAWLRGLEVGAKVRVFGAHAGACSFLRADAASAVHVVEAVGDTFVRVTDATYFGTADAGYTGDAAPCFISEEVFSDPVITLGLSECSPHWLLQGRPQNKFEMQALGARIDVRGGSTTVRYVGVDDTMPAVASTMDAIDEHGSPIWLSQNGRSQVARGIRGQNLGQGRYGVSVCGDDTSATIDHCSISRNWAGLRVALGASAIMRRTTMRENYVGGVSVEYASLRIEHSELIGLSVCAWQTASDEYVTTDPGPVGNIRVVLYCGGMFGGVRSIASTVVISNSEIKGHKIMDLSEQWQITLTKNTDGIYTADSPSFSRMARGGGLYAGFSHVTVTDTNITGNQCGVSSLDSRSCAFPCMTPEQCKCLPEVMQSGEGGGIFSERSVLVMHRVAVHSNNASTGSNLYISHDAVDSSNWARHSLLTAHLLPVAQQYKDYQYSTYEDCEVVIGQADCKITASPGERFDGYHVALRPDDEMPFTQCGGCVAGLPWNGEVPIVMTTHNMPIQVDGTVSCCSEDTSCCKNPNLLDVAGNLLVQLDELDDCGRPLTETGENVDTLATYIRYSSSPSVMDPTTCLIDRHQAMLKTHESRRFFSDYGLDRFNVGDQILIGGLERGTCAFIAHEHSSAVHTVESFSEISYTIQEAEVPDADGVVKMVPAWLEARDDTQSIAALKQGTEHTWKAMAVTEASYFGSEDVEFYRGMAAASRTTDIGETGCAVQHAPDRFGLFQHMVEHPDVTARDVTFQAEHQTLRPSGIVGLMDPGCSAHPCEPGYSCSYEDYTLRCTQCGESVAGVPLISVDGLECISCKAGTEASANRSACLPCAAGSMSADGLCRNPRPGFSANKCDAHALLDQQNVCVDASWEVDIDECATDNGGCDPLMGSQEGIGPCRNLPNGEGRVCNACPSAFLHNKTDHTCYERPLAASDAPVQKVATLKMQVAPEARVAGSEAQAELLRQMKDTLAESLGIPVAEFELRMDAQSSERRLLAEDGAVTFQIVFTSEDASVGTQMFSALNRQLANSGSTLLGSIPNVAGVMSIPVQTLGLAVECMPGSVPSRDMSKCTFCTPGRTTCTPASASSVGVECVAGVECVECPTGRTDSRGRGSCAECAPGFFHLYPLLPDARQSTTVCTRCTKLKLPDRMDQLNVKAPNLESDATCPGGVPPVGLCPMAGIWLQPVGPNIPPQLIACETDEACVATLPQYNESELTCPDWLKLEPVVEGGGSAVCSLGYTGFLCATCDVGFNKVASSCVPCEGFDWGMLALAVLMDLLTALYLLHKSTTATVSASELQQIFYKVDVNRVGSLDKKGVEKALVMTGVHMNENRLTEYMADYGTDEDGPGGAARRVIDVLTFVQLRSQSAPTAALGVAIFFLQTFGLLAKDASYFGAADFLNLDAESAAGKCLSPLSYSERFVAKTVLMPLMVAVGLLIAVPIWNTLRRLSLLRCCWERLQSPARVDRVHLQRGLINAFLALFAPLTRTAIETLVCIDTCSEVEEVEIDGGCPRVLAFDMGVACYEGDHVFAAALAVGVLVGVSVVTPLALLVKVRRSRLRRVASLALRADAVDAWFTELDADRSGTLENHEIEALLHKMGEGDGDGRATHLLEALDPDGSGKVSKPEFELWYHAQLTSMVHNPFDVLYGTTTPANFWWFLQILWLKTTINLLFTFGYYGGFAWHIWMHTLLALSIGLMVTYQPYIARVDGQVELFALLSLACLAHISSLFKTGEAWNEVYVVLAGALFLVPVVTFVVGTARAKRELKVAKHGLTAARGRGCCGRCKRHAGKIMDIATGPASPRVLRETQSGHAMFVRTPHDVAAAAPAPAGTAVAAAEGDPAPPSPGVRPVAPADAQQVMELRRENDALRRENALLRVPTAGAPSPRAPRPPLPPVSPSWPEDTAQEP